MRNGRTAGRMKDLAIDLEEMTFSVQDFKSSASKMVSCIKEMDIIMQEMPEVIVSEDHFGDWVSCSNRILDMIVRLNKELKMKGL